MLVMVILSLTFYHTTLPEKNGKKSSGHLRKESSHVKVAKQHPSFSGSRK
jgi:hypothetical protein